MSKLVMGGRLIVVEVASEMAISPEAANDALDALTLRELARSRTDTANGR